MNALTDQSRLIAQETIEEVFRVIFDQSVGYISNYQNKKSLAEDQEKWTKIDNDYNISKLILNQEAIFNYLKESEKKYEERFSKIEQKLNRIENDMSHIKSHINEMNLRHVDVRRDEFEDLQVSIKSLN